MPLTVKEIEAARFGVEKERMGDGNGLFLRLFPNGAKRFQVQVPKAPGSTSRVWLTIGDFPDLSLKQARGLAAQVRGRVANGETVDRIREDISASPRRPAPGGATGAAGPSVIVRRRQEGAGVTLREAAQSWFAWKTPTLGNGKHIAQNWTTVETYILRTLGDRLLEEITPTDIADALKPIWHKKTETAQRTLARVREIYDRAIFEKKAMTNPAVFRARTAFGHFLRRTKSFAALEIDRIPEFWAWLETQPCEEATRQATQLLVLTAKRTGETRFAEWSFFSDDGAVWSTPAQLMKMRRAHRVPLSRQAQVVLDNARLLTGSGRHLFARPGNRSGVICENAILNLVKRFDRGITGHGFRANFRTWARVRGSYKLDAMEFALAHVQKGLEEAYQRDDLMKERADLMQDWADYVTGGKDPTSLREIVEGE